MPRVCDMDGVPEFNEGYTVELWRNDDNGRLTIRAYNAAHNLSTDVDLLALLAWLRSGDAKAGCAVIEWPLADSEPER